MRRTGIVSSVSLLCVAFITLAIGASAQAPQPKSQLGTIDFPTSGSPPAQQHFLRGVAALHSFWYEEAVEAFQTASKIDPDFAMA
ncbi:MAG: tetratricopeptide repeat protein, partial [Acidobacteria bacterium]|nr:tetratricopeptide repeat protein [Acidobacteriota bacterium]